MRSGHPPDARYRPGVGRGDDRKRRRARLGPIPDRPQPVANDSHVKAKIAIIGFANNPYWVFVQKGVETANTVLSSRDGEVKWIVAGANIDVPTVDQAIRGAATQGYNGIAFFIAGEGNCALLKQMAEKKIPMGAYNTPFSCVEDAEAWSITRRIR